MLANVPSEIELCWGHRKVGRAGGSEKEKENKTRVVQNQSASDCEKMNSRALLFKENAKLKTGQNRRKGGKGSFRDYHHQNTVHQKKAGASE